MNAIEVREAYKSFKFQNEIEVIFDDFKMTVPSGSIYCLLGASGCGKSTLFSCILGVKSLESGRIKVLGENVSHKHALNCINSIGYMPQDTSLSPSMTVKETLVFFANISLMDMSLFNERYELLNNILALPSDDVFINELSGGEKRIVSLAVAMIHDPTLLLLDEPTVGLDVIIRDEIWNFLKECTTKNKNFTVLMSTHYPTEAENADLCGYMRNGKLIVENTPMSIISATNSENFHEASFNLCYQKNIDISDGYFENFEAIDDESGENNKLVSKRKTFEAQTLKAMSMTKIQQLKRSKMVFLICLFYATIQLLILNFTIGRPPIGINIGIVNEETIDCSQLIHDISLYDCKSEGLSCYFINSIPDLIFNKIFYQSIEDALNDARNGKIFGYIHIPNNFSVELMKLKRFKQKSRSGNSFIDIHLDHTQKMQYSFTMGQINEAYNRFIYNVMPKCIRPPKFYISPLNIKDTNDVELKNDFDIRLTLLPPFYLIGVIGGAEGFMIVSSNYYIFEGIWDRILLSGASAHQIGLIEIFLCILVSFAQILQAIVARLIFFNFISIDDFIATVVIIALLSLFSSLVGLFMGAVVKSYRSISSISMAFLFVFTVSCGAILPIEGMQPYLKSFFMILPAGFPAISLRNVMIKGQNIFHFSIYKSFIVLSVWTVLMLVLCFICITKRR